MATVKWVEAVNKSSMYGHFPHLPSGRVDEGETERHTIRQYEEANTITMECGSCGVIVKLPRAAWLRLLNRKDYRAK